MLQPGADTVAVPEHRGDHTLTGFGLAWWGGGVSMAHPLNF